MDGSPYLLDDLLLLDEEGAHDTVLDNSVAEVAAVDAVHCLGRPRQPPVAHLLGPQRWDLRACSEYIKSNTLQQVLQCQPGKVDSVLLTWSITREYAFARCARKWVAVHGRRLTRTLGRTLVKPMKGQCSRLEGQS